MKVDLVVVVRWWWVRVSKLSGHKSELMLLDGEGCLFLWRCVGLVSCDFEDGWRGFGDVGFEEKDGFSW